MAAGGGEVVAGGEKCGEGGGELRGSAAARDRDFHVFIVIDQHVCGSNQKWTILVLLAASLQVAAAEQEHEHPPITIDPGCPSQCGRMRIPYPFGTKVGCFLPGFQITCNNTFVPPRAFLGSSFLGGAIQHIISGNYSMDDPDTIQVDDRMDTTPMELMDISVSLAEVQVFGAVSSDCQGKQPCHFYIRRRTYVPYEGPFLISASRNVLTGVGLNVEAELTTSMYGSNSLDSCTSVPNSMAIAKEGPCNAQGCCEAAVPPGLNSIMAMADKKRTDWRKTNANCSFAMVVQKTWYNYSLEVLRLNSSKLLYPRGFPIVLDFTIGNSSCPAQGQPLPQGYACLSGNSSCVEATNRTSYVCKCWEHYDGNPYIPGGCQDINECALREQYPELRDQYPCSSGGICKNRLGGYDCPCKTGMKGDGKTGTCTEKFPLPAKLATGFAALIAFFVLIVLTYQQIKLKRFYDQNGGPVLKGVRNIRIYTRRQLKEITNNHQDVIGEGYFGKVYMGALKDESKVALKKSIKVDKDMKKEFTDEVIIQSQMRHKNIVRLLGCCLQMDVPLLVYEFVVRGSLYDVLFNHRDIVIVDKRLKIAVGSAEGLAYMHSAGESTIRHGDVKSANILLDQYFTPKVSDFRTSKLLARGKDEKTERVIRDMSYIDPVYMQYGTVTQKSDVYSFGIVLIELVTRTPATYDEGRSYVAKFVQATHDKRVSELIDNDITSQIDIKLMEMVSAVAVDCLKPNPNERLDMKQVEQLLDNIIGQSAQPAQDINNQGNPNSTPANVALLTLGFPRRRRCGRSPPSPPVPSPFCSPSPSPLPSPYPRVASPSEATGGSRPALPSGPFPSPLPTAAGLGHRALLVWCRQRRPRSFPPRSATARATGGALRRQRIRRRRGPLGSAVPGGEVAAAWLLGNGVLRWLAAAPSRPRSGPFLAPSGSGRARPGLLGGVSGGRLGDSYGGWQ
ncbi:wall-associated receptor kinase 1-like [Aegilops tauschii subsp. strangulata]|uniref:wall-associated receptor kinase 1-like n=1 Tax=Aegilops tauschii subsp. strangulata TaxID=200361 RepID=UPI003CC85DC9